MPDPVISEGPSRDVAGDARSSEVLIVGAGPTGLMAALLLTRLGVKVRIFDKNPQQAHESRALGVQARTMELFLSLGLEQKMLDAGVIVNGAQLYENGQRRAEIEFDDLGRTDTPFSFFLVVPQRDTEAILNDELRRLGVEVERQAEVLDLVQDATGVTVRGRREAGADFEAYGITRDIPQGLYLIRPDGYVAWRGASLDIAAAGSFLRERFGC